MAKSTTMLPTRFQAFASIAIGFVLASAGAAELRASEHLLDISGPALIRYAENRVARVALYSVNVPQTAIVRWSLGGRDGGSFNISSDGVLTFENPPDYEAPEDFDRDNEYLITVSASYGNLPEQSASLNVRVLVRNQTIRLNDDDPTALKFVKEGTLLVGDFNFVPGEGENISWSLGGEDSQLFTFSVRSGNEVRAYFKQEPDFENPGDQDQDNVYRFFLIGDDDGEPSESARISVEVMVQNVKDEMPSDTPPNTPVRTPTLPTINPASAIPEVIIGEDMNLYHVFASAEGGNFDTGHYRIQAGAGFLSGQALLGLRIYPLSQIPRHVRHPNYTIKGMPHAVEAVDRHGRPVPARYRTDRSIAICFLSQEALSSKVEPVVALSTNTQGLTRVVRSRIVRNPAGLDLLCGEVSEFPAIIAAGVRIPPMPSEPRAISPSPVPAMIEPPDTGGQTASSLVWVFIAIGGAMAIAIGSVLCRFDQPLAKRND